MEKDLKIEKETKPYSVRNIDFMSTRVAYDPVPNLRLYCTIHPNYHRLQLRATAPLTTDRHSGKEPAPRNLIASVDLTIEDLRQIVEYVKQYDKE